MTQPEKDTVVKQIHVHDTFTDHSIRAFGNETKQNKPETQNKSVLHIPYSIILCKTILLCLSSFMFSISACIGFIRSRNTCSMISRHSSLCELVYIYYKINDYVFLKPTEILKVHVFF